MYLFCGSFTNCVVELGGIIVLPVLGWFRSI